MDNKENCIEFISGSRSATITFTNQKHINRIKKIYEERKDGFKYFVENKDGSVCAKIPLKWVKISPTRVVNREYTIEQKREISERLRKARESRGNNAKKN